MFHGTYWSSCRVFLLFVELIILTLVDVPDDIGLDDLGNDYLEAMRVPEPLDDHDVVAVADQSFSTA
jgi:hypothetical protein